MKHVALLRGLNLGPHNRIKMPALVEVFERAGCRDVTTYIQSGNVLFEASAALLPKLPTLVAAQLEALDVRSPVVLRSAKELQATLKKNPFLARGAAVAELHVAFLGATPTKTAAASLDPQRSPPDAFELVGRDLYLHFPKGVARTKLTNAYLDAKLETLSTVRNWNTVTALAALLDG
ncbi:MAG: DUF1697 domain-containing protein [Myxococcota bacterium]